MKQSTRRGASREAPSKGVVVADFQPVCNSHVFLVNFARSYVDELTIVVDEHASDLIAYEVREKWLRELFPGVTIVKARSKVWHKSDGASISRELVAVCRKALPKSGGFIFCLEERGKKLASELNATSVPIDVSALGPVVSEKDVRRDPLKFWHALPEAVRPHFVKKVCIYGPESTGKSTLTKNLAAHFNTLAVPEYAYQYILDTGRDITTDDMLAIVRGQIASQNAAARHANKILFCDTDPMTSIIWSGRLTGVVPQYIKDMANRHHYDQYLVTNIDVPFVMDEHRYIESERRALLERCLHEVESRHRPFKLVSGGWDERLQTAIAAVEEMLAR